MTLAFKGIHFYKFLFVEAYYLPDHLPHADNGLEVQDGRYEFRLLKPPTPAESELADAPTKLFFFPFSHSPMPAGIY